MWLRRRHAVSSRLARIPLELSFGGAGHSRWLWAATLVAALGVGAAASDVYWRQRLEPTQRQAQALKDSPPLLEVAEQSRLQLRMSQARGQELEHQIDALNKSLHECQEEVTFFRKAHDGKVRSPHGGTGE